jgi:hypothetical protein
MDDQDLETRLRAYRPSDPPPALRARVVAASRGSAERSAGRAGREWLPAVAALLLATLFYSLAAIGRERLLAQFPIVDADESIEMNIEVQP